MWRGEYGEPDGAEENGCGFHLDVLQLVQKHFSSFRSSRVEEAEANFVRLPHEDSVHAVQLNSESVLPDKGTSIARMPANGSELFLDRNTRVRKIEQIASLLAQIEGKDPQVSAFCLLRAREHTRKAGGGRERLSVA